MPLTRGMTVLVSATVLTCPETSLSPTANSMVHQQEEKEADGPKSPLPHLASSTSILVSSASTVESRHYIVLIGD